MDSKELFALARDNYKKNIGPSWILGIMTGLFIAVISFAGAVSSLLLFILIAFAVMPFFFSMIVSHLETAYGGRVTLGLSFKQYGAYFNIINRSSFRVIRSALFAFLVDIASGITIGIITVIVLQFSGNTLFNDGVNSIVAAMTSGEIYELTYEEILGDSYNLFVLLDFIITVPSAILAAAAFIYFTTKNSLYIYSRQTIRHKDLRFNLLVHQYVTRKNRKAIRKDYIMLNWPLFVVFILTALGISTFIYFRTEYSSQVVTALGIASGFALLIFFFPFYFNNMEALYKKYENEYVMASPAVAQDIFNSLQFRLNQTELEKEQIEQTLKDFNKEKDDEEDD